MATTTESLDDTSIPTLERPLALLTFFTAKNPVWTLTTLSKVSGIPAPSCLRSLRALETYQFVRREGKQYMLGTQFIRMSRSAHTSAPARRQALPALEQLHRTTQRTVTWSVLEGTEAFTLEVMTAAETPPEEIQTGAPIDLKKGAVSRVLLAFAGQDVRRALLQERAALDEQVGVLDGFTRRLWLTLDVRPGHIEVASPVFQGSGSVVAALGLWIPADTTRARFDHDVHLLNRTASQISRELGYTREWQGDVPLLIEVYERLNLLTFKEEVSVGTDLINYPSV